MSRELDPSRPRLDPRRRAPVLLAACLGFLALYQLTNLGSLGSTDFADYPFGSDVPSFLTGLGNPNHPLTMDLLRGYRALAFGSLGLHESGALLKLPFALCGALNVCVAIAAFACFGERVRSLLFGAAYGCTLSVWYFASVPESYAVSCLLYSSYLLVFLKESRPAPSRTATALASGVLAAAILNDVSAALLLAIPVLYHGRNGLRSRRIRSHLGVQASIALLLIVPLGLATGWLPMYVATFREYAAVDPAAGPLALFYGHDVREPLLSFFCFGLAAPAAEVTYATRLFPAYVGFFEPSLLGYLAHPATAAFLVAYLAVLAHVRPSRRTSLVMALLGFVLARLCLVMLFNPGEAMLYVNVSVLPLLLLLFHFLESARHAYRTVIAAAFLAAVFAANARFLF